MFVANIRMSSLRRLLTMSLAVSQSDEVLNQEQVSRLEAVSQSDEVLNQEQVSRLEMNDKCTNDHSHLPCLSTFAQTLHRSGH